MFTVIANGEPDIIGDETFICKCQCGNLFEASATELALDEITNCGCIDLANSRLSDTKKLFRRYKHGAKRRKITFSLTFEQFTKLINGDCKYCGSGPTGKDFKYTGIDRIDNTKGYSIGNCCSSCFTCNRAKSTLTKEEFLLHINQIHNYMNEENTIN